jgi:putative toxin-antitoxin system antitoxin component (TIGR02293 family)
MEWSETARALGGAEVLGKSVVSGVAFAQRVEQGLPRSVIDQLKRYSRFSDADLANIIPRRTLTSFRRVRRLTADQSDRIARVAGITALAQRVFGDPDVARRWLLTANPALKDEVPLRLLRTGSGADVVSEVLVRIEHGVYE